MKIYSNVLTRAAVEQAFAVARDISGADIHIESIRTWRPRDCTYGTEVWGASRHGRRASAHNPLARAASWDDWRYAIAWLFAIDPGARIGWYDSRADFEAKVRQWPRDGSRLPFLGVLARTIPARRVRQEA
jgi:hypothetical protein